MSNKSNKSYTGSNNGLSPVINHFNTKLQVKFNESCLKQRKEIFTHKKVVNVYITYKISLWANILGLDFALGNSLFEVVNMTKNVYPN